VNDRTIRYMQRFVANVSISSSTLRGPGHGTAAAAQKYLSELDLRQFSEVSGDRFARRLDRAPSRLQEQFPNGSQHNWGAARKALNIFLRDAANNHHLRLRSRIASIDRYLEVPLDSQVAARLHAEEEGQALPRWTTIKSLRPSFNAEYQAVAGSVARRMGVDRVHLDLFYWRDSAP
jgi:hypothetical protein